MPINVAKLIQFWQNGAAEDLDTACILLKNRKRREALFWAHLALENALKANVVKATRTVAPSSHDLPYLAKRANLKLPAEKVEFLAEMNQYLFQDRSPERGIILPSSKEAQNKMQSAEEMVRWLILKL